MIRVFLPKSGPGMAAILTMTGRGSVLHGNGRPDAAAVCVQLRLRNKRSSHMLMITRWWMALVLMVALSIALTGISSAAQMPKGEKPLPVFLHQGQRTPQYADRD